MVTMTLFQELEAGNTALANGQITPAEHVKWVRDAIKAAEMARDIVSGKSAHQNQYKSVLEDLVAGFVSGHFEC